MFSIEYIYKTRAAVFTRPHFCKGRVPGCSDSRRCEVRLGILGTGLIELDWLNWIH
jgi:hypothetical protein